MASTRYALQVAERTTRPDDTFKTPLFDHKEPQMVTAMVILSFIVSIVLVLVAISQISA